MDSTKEPATVEGLMTLVDAALHRMGQIADADVGYIPKMPKERAEIRAYAERLTARESAEGGEAASVTLDANEAAFLAARLRRLFARFGYTLPGFATSDRSVIHVAGASIGGVLANIAASGEAKRGGGNGVPIHITENGVAKVKAGDVLRTPEVRRQLDAVERLRSGGEAGGMAEAKSDEYDGMILADGYIGGSLLSNPGEHRITMRYQTCEQAEAAFDVISTLIDAALPVVSASQRMDERMTDAGRRTIEFTQHDGSKPIQAVPLADGAASQRSETLVLAIREHLDGWSSATFGWQDDPDPATAERNKQAAIQAHAAECLRRIRVTLAAGASQTHEQQQEKKQ